MMNLYCITLSNESYITSDSGLCIAQMNPPLYNTSSTFLLIWVLRIFCLHIMQLLRTPNAAPVLHTAMELKESHLTSVSRVKQINRIHISFFCVMQVLIISLATPFLQVEMKPSVPFIFCFSICRANKLHNRLFSFRVMQMCNKSLNAVIPKACAASIPLVCR